MCTEVCLENKSTDEEEVQAHFLASSWVLLTDVTKLEYFFLLLLFLSNHHHHIIRIAEVLMLG